MIWAIGSLWLRDLYRWACGLETSRAAIKRRLGA